MIIFLCLVVQQPYSLARDMKNDSYRNEKDSPSNEITSSYENTLARVSSFLL